MHKSQWLRLGWAATLGAAAFLRAAVCMPSENAALAPPLIAAAASAKAAFTVPTAEQIDQATRDARGAVESLLAHLASIPTGGEAVRQLDLRGLAAELERPALEPARMAWFAEQFDIAPPHVDRHIYDATRRAVMRLADLVAVRAGPDSRLRFDALLDDLTSAAAEFDTTASHAAFDRVRTAYAELTHYPQADAVLAIVRSTASRPNQVVRVSHAFVVAAIDRDIAAPITIDEREGSAQVRGAGTISGHLTPSLPIDPARGQIHVNFRGIGATRLTVQQRRATVLANGRLNITGGVTLTMTNEGLSHGPVSKCITSRTVPYSACVATRIRALGKLASRVVLKVGAKQMARRDPQAAQKAGAKVEELIIAQVDPLVVETNRWFDRLYWRPLARRAIDPNIALRTTSDRIEWIARYARDDELAAPDEPPPFAGALPGIAVQFHESAVTNCSPLLADRRLAEPEFHELVYGTLNLVPEESIGRERGQIPVAIRLASRKPLDAEFHEGLATVTLRLAAFEHQGIEYVRGADRDSAAARIEDATPAEAPPYWTARVSYRTGGTREAPELVRVGSIEVEPLDADGRLLAEEVLPRLLTRRAVREPASESAESSLFAVSASHMSFDQGWMSLGFTAVVGSGKP